MGLFLLNLQSLIPTRLLVTEKPECERGGLLLSKEFVKNYRDMCSAQAKATETVTREFQSKNINILDPLKHDNNLGRSVSRGDFSC